ncbi:MAG: Membrane-bound lytic murein transglycosylase B [Alphaproteobacteria bacterium MarineAlpha4_Bin2]|nr:MAG: Membrane-bound lytic murein transglycosylase B [Alphaproteobacteria bacterium MarineAlpha4_Bin2]
MAARLFWFKLIEGLRGVINVVYLGIIMTFRISRVILISLTMLTMSVPTFTLASNDFDAWLEDFSHEARRKGISDATLTIALRGLKPVPRVIELDRRQPEFTLTFANYMKRVVTSTRIRKARARFTRHRELLKKIGKRFKVQPRFIIALWGIETDFGRITGGFNVIPALATLAHDGRRSAFFRSELLNALTIVDQGHIRPGNMKGSWAGAMGQVQFMPSSFLNFAVDFDGDGQKDLWTTHEDVFASAANYLSKSGWNGSQTWGRLVLLPQDFDSSLINYKNVRKPLSEWQMLGLRRAGGGDLPKVEISASLVRPMDGKDPAFLVYGNYRSILKWNRSHYFALAVGRLADAIIHR